MLSLLCFAVVSTDPIGFVWIISSYTDLGGVDSMRKVYCKLKVKKEDSSVA